MGAIEIIKNLTHGFEFPHDEGACQELISAYEALDRNEVRELMYYALQIRDQLTASVILRNLSLLFPGSLASVQRRLLDRKMDDWEMLFIGAEPSVCTELAYKYEHTKKAEKRSRLIKALAWAGTETAQDILRCHLDDEITFSEDYSVQVRDMIPEAGWEFSLQGTRRDLFFPDCYQLTFLEADPLEIPSPPDCPWCGHPMSAPFRFDFSGISWRWNTSGLDRVNITTCFNCVQYEALLMDLDDDGNTNWRADNQRPEWWSNPAAEDVLEKAGFSTHQFGVSGQFISPYQPVSWLPFGPNRLGGLPGWVQEPAYPVCPDCGMRMKFLAQFDYGGVYFAFLCPECRTAATTAQFD